MKVLILGTPDAILVMGAILLECRIDLRDICANRRRGMGIFNKDTLLCIRSQLRDKVKRRGCFSCRNGGGGLGPPVGANQPDSPAGFKGGRYGPSCTTELYSVFTWWGVLHLNRGFHPGIAAG